MASLRILDGTGADQYLLMNSGAGTVGDPYIPQQTVTLLAGTAAIGKLAANSGVDIGDVDVLTLCGQSIAFNAGAVGSTVPRVTLASDDPAVALLGTIVGHIDGVEASLSSLVMAAATTIVGHIDGVETVLGTIDADTSALAGCVSGTEVQVDLVAALPAGTNTVGNVVQDDYYTGHNGAQVQRKTFNAVVSTATTTDLIAAVAGKKFKIIRISVMVISGTGTWRLIDATPANFYPAGATGFTYDLTGATGPAGWRNMAEGLITANANQKLQVVSTGTGSFAIDGEYIEVS